MGLRRILMKGGKMSPNETKKKKNKQTARLSKPLLGRPTSDGFRE